MQQIAQTEPSAPSKCQKWWHVSDEQIEELVQKRINVPQVSQAQTQAQARVAACRTRTVGAKAQRSVQFHEALQEDAATAQERFGDSLDQALREHTSPVPEKAGQQRQQQKKTKAWRVPDEKILDLVETEAKTLAREGENVAPIGKALANYGRFVIGCEGDLSDIHRNCSTQNLSCQDCPGKCCHQVPELVGSNRITHRSTEKGSAHRKGVSCLRPAWVSQSAPKIFAGVGIGLDGKGNKTIKPGCSKFESNPIYLSDFRDTSLSRVRTAVCGNPFYLKR